MKRSGASRGAARVWEVEGARTGRVPDRIGIEGLVLDLDRPGRALQRNVELRRKCKFADRAVAVPVGFPLSGFVVMRVQSGPKWQGPEQETQRPEAQAGA